VRDYVNLFMKRSLEPDWKSWPNEDKKKEKGKVFHAELHRHKTW
jgi:hypothetical protein